MNEEKRNPLPASLVSSVRKCSQLGAKLYILAISFARFA